VGKSLSSSKNKIMYSPKMTLYLLWISSSSMQTWFIVTMHGQKQHNSIHMMLMRELRQIKVIIHMPIAFFMSIELNDDALD